MIDLNLKNFRTELDLQGIMTVWIDVQDRSMNVFHDGVILELERLVAELSDTDGVRAIVFRSAKPSGFFAGADVHQIAALRTHEEVETVIRRGQELFGAVERLPMPTIAAIHGPCLGGGLEFALACRHRIAMDVSSTRIGLPEIQLGLIPGWGGTQRLPKTVGLLTALPMILQGKKLTASAALKAGLVDAVFDEGRWDEGIVAFVETKVPVPATTLHHSEHPVSPRRVNWKSRLLHLAVDNPLGHWLVLRTAEKKIARDAANYPALPAALKAIRASFNSTADGFKVERDEFAALIETSTCRNLLNLFLRREDARSQTAGRGADNTSEMTGNPASAVKVRKVAVIGAGAMGAGIGQLAVLKGFDVVLKELNSELAHAGRVRVAALLDDMVSRRQFSVTERNAALDRVTATDSFADLSDCDLVIEAVVEKMEIKRRVFAELDAVLKDHAVIVSNTSALSVTEMSKATGRPDRVAGLHFFNPVHRMDLVEIVRTETTSDATVEMLLKLVKKLGKTPVITSDTPGFLVNRVLFPYIGEAVRMILEGHSAGEIDREIKRFGMPMGPIELIDHVGIDIAWHVAETLRHVLPESDSVIRLLGEMTGRGWIGKKSGTGFFVYRNGKRLRENDLSALNALTRVESPEQVVPKCCGDDCHHDNVGSFLPDGLTDIQRRLIYPMINETGFCLQEEVVAEPWMADLAMVLGTGFAPFRGGPMTMADAIDRGTLLNNMAVLNARLGERFKPSAWLVERGNLHRKPKNQENVPV
ncbi:MAG: 3-hydroxyacyl-CoA dehydrogenase NAD-binding domain-containing protein [Planctomycetaceae bacterium]